MNQCMVKTLHKKSLPTKNKCLLLICYYLKKKAWRKNAICRTSIFRGSSVYSSCRGSVTEVPFEGRVSSEGPLSNMPLKGQVVSKPHEEPSSLVKSVSGLALEAITLDKPVMVPNAQLAVVEGDQSIQIGVGPMQVDGTGARDPHNPSPRTNTAIEISPPEVSSAPRTVLSRLSQPPPLQLEVHRSHSYHPQGVQR